MLFINTSEALNRISQKILESVQSDRQTCIGIDTEFKTNGYFYPKLCLIQMAYDGEVYLIDTLCELNYELFSLVLTHHNIEKIVHAPKHDIDTIYQDLGCFMKPIFDTQLAAEFLESQQQQISLSNLMQMCDLPHMETNKNLTRSDWSKRPLSTAQIEYATDDVLYLPNAREHLIKQLKAAQCPKYDWFVNESYLRTRFYEHEPPIKNSKIKLYKKEPLKGEAEIRQIALENWRYEKAQQINDGLRSLLSDSSLYYLARYPLTLNEIQELKQSPYRLKHHQCQEYGAEILECLQQSQTSVNPKLIHDPKRKTGRSYKSKAMLSLNMEGIREVALKHELCPSLLASKPLIQAYFDSEQPEETILRRSWRWPLIQKFF